jgi:hypothetical protein
MWIVEACSGRWNIRVGKDDADKLHKVVESTADRTGEFVSQAGTIRRAVRELYDRECGVGHELMP